MSETATSTNRPNGTANSVEQELNSANKGPINPKFKTESLSARDIEQNIKDLLALNNFPLSALPQKIQRIIRATNESLNFPLDIIASALMHAASTAIGHTHVIKWKWIENGVLYMVIVGNPGTNKTHPVNFAYAPIVERDRESYKVYKEEMKIFDIANTSYQKNKKDGFGEAPIKPILKKFIVSDCTIEAMTQVLQYNTRGICSHNDELAGWFNNMNRYNNGSDAQQHLQNWSGQPIVLDRISRSSVRIEKPFANVIGTIQPAVLDEMSKDNKDKNGFTHRFLFVWPKGVRRQCWNTNELDNQTRGDWFGVINRLLSLEFTKDSDGNDISNQLWFQKDAESLLRQWQQENIKEDDDFGNETRDGISAKIETYVIRFCLILQLLKWACGESDKKTIEAETVLGAIAIAKYFKRTALEVAEYVSNRNPVDRLPDNKQKIYLLLPSVFTTEQGLVIAGENDMPERTFKHWIKDKTIFKHVKHGEYQKLFV